VHCNERHAADADDSGGHVISRIWRGWAPPATADNHQRHYETEVGEHLRTVGGFRAARLLRQEDGQGVMFTSITFFTSLAAVRGFAGDDYEQAAVEDAAGRALSHWDERVSHHEVVGMIDLRLR
jgi:heme-degrading monooxygenase HmoA